jgi:hypothetical protein
MIQAFEHAFVFVEHRAGLAVHDLAGADYIAAKGLADGLMAQAHAQNRQLAGEVLDDVNRDAGFGRGARAGRNDDALGVEGFDFGNGEFIVAHDFDLGAQLTKVLHNVVGKRVVVIDHQQHGERTS